MPTSSITKQFIVRDEEAFAKMLQDLEGAAASKTNLRPSELDRGRAALARFIWKGNGDKMKFINEDKTVITLPVPLGSTIYQVSTKCGDFCTFQQELFDKIFPPTKEGRCGKEKPCHAVEAIIYKKKLEFSNMEYVLKNWETWFFLTEDAAEQRMKEVVEANRKKMLELGFNLRDDGYGLIGEVSKHEEV